MSNENVIMSNENIEGMEGSASVDLAREYLAFVSDGLHFVVSAANIIEIITHHSITRLPKVPDFIKGIINLRGQVIPIIDVRLRMGKPDVEYTEEACVIVIEVNNISIGLLVESVTHVVNIDDENIVLSPSKSRQELTKGIANIDNTVYLVLDCKAIVDQEV